MSKYMISILAVVVLLASAGALQAADAPTETPAVETAAAAATSTSSQAIVLVGACLGAAISAIGGGYAVSRVGRACVEAIARQPEASGAMFAPMFVSAAMIEGGMLFGIVVCVIAIFRV